MINGKKKRNNVAIASISMVVFSAIFALIISGVINLSIAQHKLVKAKMLRQNALDLAESGLEYAEWFASRFPEDYQDGTGTAGPYTHTVKDPESGQDLGTFTIDITPHLQCGKLISMDIYSTGTAQDEKGNVFKRTLFAKLAKPSVARFSYIIDSNVWAGDTRNIVGPYHSNGGIRMDGTNNSLVTSAKSTWWCDGSFGCSPGQYKPGIFGSGPGSALWKYPTEELPFINFSSNLTELKDLAQNQGGIYLSRFTGASGSDRKGYELIFKDNGTVDIYKVTRSYWYWGKRNEYEYDYYWDYGWRRERNRIRSKTFMGNYSVPSSCSLIYSEEKLWVKGTVEGKVFVIAARSSGSYKPEIVLEDNILYNDADGSDGLTLVAQSYILIPEYSPNNMTLNGIFVAQEGSFGRSYYSNNKRNSLTINGSVVSKERVGTAWSCGWTGYFCSGYANRINSYDRFLRTDPPPFTPSLSENQIFVKWRED